MEKPRERERGVGDETEEESGWAAHLTGENRLPAELQGGGNHHEQTRLLAHQERPVGGTLLRQLHVREDTEGVRRGLGLFFHVFLLWQDVSVKEASTVNC